MANILLIEDNEVAVRSMRGILTRRHHRLVVAPNAEEAWRLLRQIVKIDVIFLEIKLQEGNGIAFLQRLRQDCLLKKAPAVVYTAIAEPQVVKLALSLAVQNYLIKPYKDDLIYAELAKAGTNPWRTQHFEEEKSFCTQMCLNPEDLRKMREEVRTSLGRLAQALPDLIGARNLRSVLDQITALSEQAEVAGVWGAVDLLAQLSPVAESMDWNTLQGSIPEIQIASKLLNYHLNPDLMPPEMLSEQELNAKEEARERSLWVDADVDRSGPIVAAKIIEQKLETLTGWPVIDTVAASFQMTADGKASSLAQVMDLAAGDPGLSAQVLAAANHLDRDESMNAVEDPKTAVSLLGEIKLQALAKNLPMVEERYMHFPPNTWAQFWMFQTGVARLSKFVCDYLEFRVIEPSAFTAGLLHDAGKLLLLKLYPFAFEATVGYARLRGVPLQTAETKFLGWTTREIGSQFGRKIGLPARYCNVMQWVETPDQAKEDADLVAIVSLARLVCLHNHVGYCGDTPKDKCPPLSETVAWQVISSKVFPSFNLAKFEIDANGYCQNLKQELLGRQR